MYSATRIRILLLAAAMLAFAPATAFATASYSAIGQAAIGVADPVSGITVEALDGTDTETFTDEGPGGSAAAVANADTGIERIAMTEASVAGSAETDAASSAWAVARYDIMLSNTTNEDITISLFVEARLQAAVAIDDAALEAAGAMSRFAVMVGDETIVEADVSEMLDEIADSLSSEELFGLGFEVFVLSFPDKIVWLMASAIPLVLLARFVAVSLPISVLGIRQEFTAGAVPVLTWGGLRGGISVALALSLPAVAEKDAILALTYAVVVFSIIVQGLTFKSVVARFVDGVEPPTH